MSEWLLLASSLPTGLAIMISYAIVLANFGGFFPLPDSMTSSSYFDSPYWLGLPRNSAAAVTVLQLFAALGYFMWIFWIVQAESIENSILSTRMARLLLLQGFLISSVIWPFTTYNYVITPTLSTAILASAPLWSAAICMILLIGGTFEAMAPPHAIIGILWLGMIVVLADGVGWSAVCIKRVV